MGLIRKKTNTREEEFQRLLIQFERRDEEAHAHIKRLEKLENLAKNEVRQGLLSHRISATAADKIGGIIYRLTIGSSDTKGQREFNDLYSFLAYLQQDIEEFRHVSLRFASLIGEIIGRLRERGKPTEKIEELERDIYRDMQHVFKQTEEIIKFENWARRILTKTSEELNTMERHANFFKMGEPKEYKSYSSNAELRTVQYEFHNLAGVLGDLIIGITRTISGITSTLAAIRKEEKLLLE